MRQIARIETIIFVFVKNNHYVCSRVALSTRTKPTLTMRKKVLKRPHVAVPEKSGRHGLCCF
jgi:hypothetical protein